LLNVVERQMPQSCQGVGRVGLAFHARIIARPTRRNYGLATA
jgi:hypothetical protein